MLRNNPNCFVVTGLPRTPRDQGSVESGNKLVSSIRKNIACERCRAGLDDNWTLYLGQIMACCNSHAGRARQSISNYEAVFGMKFHTGIRCPLSEMQKCRNISERLHISLDDRLAKLVEEMDIVDGLADDNPSLAQNAPPDDDPELDPPVVDDITEDDLRMYDEMVQLAKSGEANVDLLDNDSMDMYNDDNAMSVDIDGENEEESHHLASSLKSDVSEDQRRSKTHTPVNPYQANFIPPISPPMGAASASAMPTFTHTYQTPSTMR